MQANTLVWCRQNFSYPVRVATAAVVALLTAQLVGLPDVYWAAISAVVVMQDDFDASVAMGWYRLAGTALGALAGALVAGLGRNPAVFALGVLAVGVVSALLRLKRPANRFAAITLAVVYLIPHAESPWKVALDRFLVVATGILIGVCLAAIWSEPPAGKS